MGYIASLDLGNDSFRMALAERTPEGVRLLGIESVASQGFRLGELTDASRLKAALGELLDRLEQDYGLRPDELHAALPTGWLSRVEVRKATASTWAQPGMREIARVPLSETSVQIYLAPEQELEELEAIFHALGMEDVSFFSAGEALAAALSGGTECADFAVFDLGAQTLHVAVVIAGERIYEAELLLGGSSIDSDLMRAFSIHDRRAAKKLKEECGQALLAECKAQSVMIPGTQSSIERQDLVLVEQARLEELLEGAVWQMLQSGYYTDLTDGIFSVGGGSRVAGLPTLLRKLSGHTVRPARITGRIVGKGAWLQAPEYVKVLGLLCCGEGGTAKRSIWKQFASIFKQGKLKGL